MQVSATLDVSEFKKIYETKSDKMRIPTFAIICVFILSGCATVRLGDPMQDSAAKEFKPPSEKAGVYVYRNQMMGSAVRMDVFVDGIKVGETAQKTYLYFELPPGRYTIESRAENIDSLTTDFRAGTLSYIWQEVRVGFYSARSYLHLVDETEGRKGVGESVLAVSNLNPPPSNRVFSESNIEIGDIVYYSTKNDPTIRELQVTYKDKEGFSGEDEHKILYSELESLNIGGSGVSKFGREMSEFLYAFLLIFYFYLENLFP